MSRTTLRLHATLMAAIALIAVVFAGGAIAANSPTAPPAPPGRQDYTNRYASLADHNIFLKERGKPATSRPSRSGSNGGRNSRRNPIDTTFVLTGIVLEDGRYHAYVEDGQRSKLLRLVVGEPVARGRLDAIEIDSVVYTVGGQQTIVEIGQNFTGGPATATTGPTTATAGGTDDDEGEPTAATTAPTSTGGIDPNDPNLTLEQKMKLRRLQGK